jgi:hypothetical protein
MSHSKLVPQTITLKIREFTTDLIPPNIKNMYVKKQGGVKIAVIGKPGTGKCLAYNTEVIMYDGTIKHVQDIIEGDLLMGDDSTARCVSGVSTGIDNMYSITQSNGISYTVNEAHILSFKQVKSSSRGLITKNIDLSVQEYLSLSTESKEELYGYRVDVSWPHKKIDHEPYHLGAYLSSKKILNVDLDFYKYISKNSLYELGEIPRDYMINSLPILLAFISGVIDYSGKIINGEIVISHFSEKFIKSMKFILNSMGMYAKINGDLKGPPFKLSFVPNCYIPTAILNVSHLIDTDQDKSRIDVKYISKGKYYGFQLDGNSRFLLNDFTVTHNTTLINRLIYEKRHIIPVGFAMSGTEESNHNYRDKCGFPEVFIYEKWNKQTIERFIKRQKIAIDYLQNPWCVAVVDDCMDKKSEFRTELIEGFYKNGRHWKPFWILSLQYAIDILPVIIVSIDIAFIGREPNDNIRKKIYEKYAGIIPTYSLFCSLMEKFTSDHSFLVVLNNNTSNKLEDCVFYWKPEPVPDFKFGCADYREFAEERFDREYKPSY